MAKKQTRRYQSPRRGGDEEARGRSRLDREFNPDYAPVIKDLRRIGMLAGTFFVILIVLSFVI
jgi:hypothetical protein